MMSAMVGQVLASEGFSKVEEVAFVEPGEIARILQKLQNNPPATEQDARIVVANVIAEGSKPQWVEDVRKRKTTIATGSGAVHGARYADYSHGVRLVSAGRAYGISRGSPWLTILPTRGSTSSIKWRL